MKCRNDPGRGADPPRIVGDDHIQGVASYRHRAMQQAGRFVSAG